MKKFITTLAAILALVLAGLSVPQIANASALRNWPAQRSLTGFSEIAGTTVYNSSTNYTGNWKITDLNGSDGRLPTVTVDVLRYDGLRLKRTTLGCVNAAYVPCYKTTNYTGTEKIGYIQVTICDAYTNCRVATRTIY